MHIVTKNIICNQETFTLTNQRALYWESEGALVLSDLHVGKSAHFRKHGIPIPDNVLIKDLERLKALIAFFKPKTVLIVGDLFHAEFNTDVAHFKIWLQQFPNINFELIIGNHDRLSLALYKDLNITIYRPKKSIKKTSFVHDNVKSNANEFIISGHTHPGVIIKGKAKQFIKLPCYQVSSNQLILPAFSLFTGLNTKNCPKECVNYAFTDGGIYKV